MRSRVSSQLQPSPETMATLRLLADDDADQLLAADDFAARADRPLFLPTSAASSDDLRFCRFLHIAVMLQAVNVFTAAIDFDEELLLQLEPDDSTIVHTLARCQHRLQMKEAKRLENAIVAALARSSDITGRLLLQEDSGGFRPAEACARFGAFRLLLQLLHLPGYLLLDETFDQGWLIRRYDLSEYDILHGSRYKKSPLSILTFITKNQVQLIKKSKLTSDPLMKEWKDVVVRQTRIVTFLRIVVTGVPSFIFMMTIASIEMLKTVSSFGLLIHCNRAAYTAAAAAGVTADKLRNATVYYDYLIRQKVKSVDCGELTDALNGNKTMVIAVASLMLLSFVAKVVVWLVTRFEVRRIFRGRTEGVTQCFVRRPMFDFFHLMATACGLCLVALFEIYFGEQLWYLQFQPAAGASGLALEQVIMTANAFFIAFCLLYFSQYMEILNKSIGKLFITFNRMNSSFLAALPLLFYWIVVFSLMFFAVVDTTDFATNMLSLYSAVRAVMNMVTFPLDNPIALVLHSVFFVFVGLNLLNFLIAFVSDTYAESNEDFDVMYWLLKMHAAVKSFRYYSWILRLPHLVEAARKRECSGSLVVEVRRPAFKKLKFLKDSK